MGCVSILLLAILAGSCSASSDSDTYQPTTPRQDSYQLPPEDDLDGDGWVDDPCPDKSIPLSAEC